MPEWRSLSLFLFLFPKHSFQFREGELVCMILEHGITA